MKTRANEIDLLRFIAALSVVLFHYGFRGYSGADKLTTMPYSLLGPVAMYGYLGVDLFFVISGFVILMTASNSSLKGFFASRVARLYPAFWVCCTATYLVIAVFDEKQQVSFSQYLVNLTMLSAFLNVPSIDGSYWSLFVEVRFYVLVAALMAIGGMARAELALALWLAAAVLLNAHPIGVLNFVLIADYAAHFIAGAIFYLIWSCGLSTFRVCMLAVAWVMVMRHATGEIAQLEQNFKQAFEILVVLGVVTCIFLVMLLVSLRKTGVFMRMDWALVGALTYPLYLLHQMIGYIVFNLAYPTLNAHLVFWGTIVCMLLAAYLVHVKVETKYGALLRRYAGEGWERIVPRMLLKKG